MKRFVCASLAAIMLFSSTVFADTTANVFIGEKPVEYSDQTPVIINDRTYIPIRDVFEDLDYAVDWDAESKIVSLSNDYYQIMLFTKTDNILTLDTSFDLNYKKLENPVQIVNGRTMLPLREILETANYSLDWDAETKSAIVTDNNDYTLLDKQADELENLFSEDSSATYEYDPSKPSEELTEEEYAFLDNMFATLVSLENISEDMDVLENVDEITPETARIFKNVISQYTDKFSDVECPESLKGLDTNLQNFFDNIVDDALVIGEISQDNPDDSDILFAVAMAYMVGIMKDAVTALQPLTDLCEEKNLDMESIFGEKYDQDFSNFGLENLL